MGKDGVFITPTLADCVAVAETGCEVVALDGTRRARPDGLSLAETVAGLKERFPDVLVMADCGSAGDAVAAQEAGADLIGTTLVGYSGERPKTDGPDWEAVDEMLAVADRPLIVEGRLHTPADAAEAMRRGAAPGPWWSAPRSPTRRRSPAGSPTRSPPPRRADGGRRRHGR